MSREMQLVSKQINMWYHLKKEIMRSGLKFPGLCLAVISDIVTTSQLKYKKKKKKNQDNKQKSLDK